MHQHQDVVTQEFGSISKKIQHRAANQKEDGYSTTENAVGTLKEKRDQNIIEACAHEQQRAPGHEYGDALGYTHEEAS